MDKLVDYAKGILADGKGSPSSKRVITFLFALLMAVAFIANLFYGYNIDAKLLDSVMYIVIAGFGFTGIEKFAPNGLATSAQ
jgi:glucan phosphoethanolaminetransferase (alkaline phosphatase superfamily)